MVSARTSSDIFNNVGPIGVGCGGTGDPDPLVTGRSGRAGVWFGGVGCGLEDSDGDFGSFGLGNGIWKKATAS